MSYKTCCEKRTVHVNGMKMLTPRDITSFKKKYVKILSESMNITSKLKVGWDKKDAFHFDTISEYPNNFIQTTLIFTPPDMDLINTDTDVDISRFVIAKVCFNRTHSFSSFVEWLQEKFQITINSIRDAKLFENIPINSFPTTNDIRIFFLIL